MIFGSTWNEWRRQVLAPFAHALFKRTPDSLAVQRHAASSSGLFEECQEAAARANEFGFHVDSEWQHRCLVISALDRQDNFARLLGLPISGPNQLKVQGRWPSSPFIALGLHWGTGFPVLENLLSEERQPAFVYRPENSDELDSMASRLFNRLHMRALRGFGGCIQVGGAYQRIIESMAEGKVPVVLFDAPPVSTAGELVVRRSGYRFSLRSGLFRLLATQQLPFVFFRCGYQPGCERRLLEISSLMTSSCIDEIAEIAVDYLLESLYQDAAQWHLWSVTEGFLALSSRDEQTHSFVHQEVKSRS